MVNDKQTFMKGGIIQWQVLKNLEKFSIRVNFSNTEPLDARDATASKIINQDKI